MHWVAVATKVPVEVNRANQPCVPTAHRIDFCRQLETAEEICKLPSKESLLPELLSQTGLYQDIEQKLVHPAMLPYKPEYQLWSDAEFKQRWTYIPECDKIDSTRMDDWSFPIGTRFFKEFQRDGVRIETRLIERFGPGDRDFAMASYQWNEAETEATKVAEEGIENVRNSGHDIPSKAECLQCHGTYSLGGGRPSRGLGFSAIQLSHSDSETTLQTLIDSDLLSRNPAHAVAFLERVPRAMLLAICIPIGKLPQRQQRWFAPIRP